AGRSGPRGGWLRWSRSRTCYCHPATRALPSFPTRRSSDLIAVERQRLLEQSNRSRVVVFLERRPSEPERRGSRSWLQRERAFERSEEHTSELQSRGHLVCGLLLE